MKADSDLWQKICDEETFQQAWRKVRANMGGPGIDRISLEDFESNLSQNLSLLRNLLQQGLYQPLPLITKEIEKEGGNKRILKIPSIRDRIVQEAVLLVLQPVLDDSFLDCSYGYRPKRSAIMAVKRIERHIKKGKQWIVDADVQDFFDTVNQELLINLFSEKVSDLRVVKLVKGWIESPSKDGIGIPQGVVISPLLANSYLHSLDKNMVKGPGHYVRYCDDFVILCDTQEEAQSALEKAKRCLEEELFLKINQEKTRICHLNEGFIFLGFQFAEGGRKPCPRAIERLMTKIEKELEGFHELLNEELQRKLNLIIRGWQNYFQLDIAERTNLLKQIDAIAMSCHESIPIHILKAALCIREGEKENAYEIIKENVDLPSDDGEIHYQLGILCDAIGLVGEAREKYFKTLRIIPDHKEALYHLAVNYLQEGKIEKAIRFLQKAAQLSPESPEVHLAIGSAFEKWGLYGVARKAFNRAKELDPNLRITPNVSRRAMDGKIEAKSLISYSEEDLNLFLRLFSGREGVYARQWVDGTGKSGYYPITKPLSREDICEHLEGKMTLGLYLMRADNTVKVAVIDIDVSKKTIEESGAGNSEWRSLVQRDANKIADFLENYGIPIYAEMSGWKGVHCWLFFGQPLRAAEVRNFLKEVIRKIGPPPAGIHREIFPKQDSVNKGGLGCLIKLPLGIHMITNQRAFFVDREGKPYGNQMVFLWQIRPVSIDKVRETISKIRTTHEEKLIQIDNTPVERLLEKCNVIRFLVEKAEREKDLRHFERLILLHTLGHLGKAGRKSIHRIMGHCLNYSYVQTERWIKRVHHFPLSCPRIREWLSDITPGIGCYCEFPVPEKGYPSPILHANLDAIIKIREGSEPEKIKFAKKISDVVEEKGIESVHLTNGRKSPSISEDDPEELIKTYIQLKKDRKEIEEKFKEIERRLELIFQSKGTDSIQIDIGNLTRVMKEDKTLWVIEL